MLGFVSKRYNRRVFAERYRGEIMDPLNFYVECRSKIENLPNYPTGENLTDVTWKAPIANRIKYKGREYSELETERSAGKWLTFC